MRKHLDPAAESNGRRTCVIHGVGGIGKTELAIEHARLHENMYTSVFWLDGKTEDSLLQSLMLIASRLLERRVLRRDIRETEGTEELKERAKEVLRWFALEGNHDWLLIFDNIDKTSTLAPHSEAESLVTYDIRSYFPDGDRGSIIITTRLKRLTRLGKSIQLNKLDIKHGMMILERMSRMSMKLSENSEGSKDSELKNYDSGESISWSMIA
jgi:hypothetical protein